MSRYKYLATWWPLQILIKNIGREQAIFNSIMAVIALEEQMIERRGRPTFVSKDKLRWPYSQL